MSTAENNCRWHFAKLSGGSEDGPNEPMQQNFKKTPYASLVRESIQNSLDVPLYENKPVRIEYSISKINATNYPNLFELRKHIQGCLYYFHNNENAKEVYQPMLDYLDEIGNRGYLSYIKISDYNTQGMNYIKNDTNTPFYAFVISRGVSVKNEGSTGGSYGFGKAAYFYISNIRTLLINTQTKDNRHFFEGIASLCTHKIEGEDEKFVSTGFYDNNGGNPITNSSNIPPRFNKRDEPGTDFFILGIDASNEEAIFEEMIKAVLQNFWLAIYRNHLEVKIGDIEINKDNLAQFIEQYFPDELDTKIKAKGYNPKPYLDAVMNVGQDNRHILISQQFPTIGNVKLYVVKDKRATDKILYMRRPLMLVKAQKTGSQNGFYGVFVCEDIYGDKILKHTENPAHNEWVASNWKDKGKTLENGRKAIQEIEEFIKSAIEKIFLNKNKNVQKIQGLDEFLYIPTAVEEDEDDSESLVGEVVGVREEEGNSISTNISQIKQQPTEDKPAIGKVIIEQQNENSQKHDPKGNNLGGHGKQKRHNKTDGNGVSSDSIDSHFSNDENGTNGSFLTEVPVTYRSFAQIEDGIIVHKIIIHSDYNFNNGRIDLLVGGEQSDDKIQIKSCEPFGKIKENTISGLTINKGKNIIKVKFADNMKHAVKLEAYETK